MSNRAYLFIYDNGMGTRAEVKDFVDRCPDIQYWRYDLPNTFYLVSDLSAQKLYDAVQEFNAERGRFLICEVGKNKQGWLPKRTWHLLNRKTFQESPERTQAASS